MLLLLCTPPAMSRPKPRVTPTPVDTCVQAVTSSARTVTVKRCALPMAMAAAHVVTTVLYVVHDHSFMKRIPWWLSRDGNSIVVCAQSAEAINVDIGGATSCLWQCSVPYSR